MKGIFYALDNYSKDLKLISRIEKNFFLLIELLIVITPYNSLINSLNSKICIHIYKKKMYYFKTI